VSGELDGTTHKRKQTDHQREVAADHFRPIAMSKASD
jgi:hypothetical protein